MTYQETLKSHKADLLRLKSERLPIDLEDVFRPVDWSETEINKMFFAWLMQEKLAGRRDIDSARARDNAQAVLGKYPKTCCEYVGAFVDVHQVVVSYTGMITLDDPRNKSRASLIITDIMRDVRVMASELGLPFQRDTINDAVESWYQDARSARVDAIRESIGGGGEFDWVELARRCFDCSEMSAEFVAAILRKFVHQVKLKLADRKVGHHLMPVLLGPQGIGKTEFVKALISPLAELAREATFQMLADERNIMLWRSYVLFIDEMAYADRSDVDVVKHVVSAEKLDRRPMRTNDIVTIWQLATFIGASNKTMAELLRDETGMRRFIGIMYRVDADWVYLNGLDWHAAWRSVSIDEADPMAEFRDQLAAIQSETRHVSPVEAWLTQLSPTTCTHVAKGADPIASKDLYDDYLSHFHGHNDGQRAKGFHAWEQELGRLLKTSNDSIAIEKHKTKASNIWRWRSRLMVVDGRLAA